MKSEPLNLCSSILKQALPTNHELTSLVHSRNFNRNNVQKNKGGAKWSLIQYEAGAGLYAASHWSDLSCAIEDLGTGWA
jgi:hypothetical protein